MEMQSEDLQHIAIVYRAGVMMCRLSTVAPGRGDDEIRTELADKARAWIHQYLAREQEGDRQTA